MLWLILLPLIMAVLFFTWVLCRASALAKQRRNGHSRSGCRERV